MSSGPAQGRAEDGRLRARPRSPDPGAPGSLAAPRGGGGADPRRPRDRRREPRLSLRPFLPGGFDRPAAPLPGEERALVASDRRTRRSKRSAGSRSSAAVETWPPSPQSRRALEAGDAVAIFPQGTVLGSADRPWQRGAARVALTTGRTGRPRQDRRSLRCPAAGDAAATPRARAGRRRRADRGRARVADDPGDPGADGPDPDWSRASSSAFGSPAHAAGTLDPCRDADGNP